MIFDPPTAIKMRVTKFTAAWVRLAAWGLALGLASGVISPLLPGALAGDLEEAQQFLERQPAFRMKSTMVYADSKAEHVTEIEIVRGGPAHERTTENGAETTDLITNGQWEALRVNGQPVEVESVSANALKNIFDRASLGPLLEGARSKWLAQREEVNGTAALVYSVVDQGESTAKVWLAETDLRPLKMEKEGPHGFDAHGVELFQPFEITSTTFEYGSDIKIVMPPDNRPSAALQLVTAAPGTQNYHTLTLLVVGGFVLAPIVAIGLYFTTKSEDWD